MCSCRFLSNLLLFLQLDSGVPQGVTQQVTHRVAQHLTGAVHGDNVKLLSSMIQVGGPHKSLKTLLFSHRTCGVSSYGVGIPISWYRRAVRVGLSWEWIAF